MFEQIRKEFSVDEFGVVYASQKAVAEMCGVSNTAIALLVKKLTEKLTPPEIFESFYQQDFIGKKLPDNLFEKIVEYYAFNAGRYCTERAKTIYRTYSKINFRQAISAELKIKPNSQINDCQENDENNYIINRQELLGLKTEGLVTLRSYVYFALRIDGIEQKIHQINTEDFCNRWCIGAEDYLIAIASLKKKGVVNVEIPDFGLRVYAYDEKIKLMEKQFSG